MGTRWHGDSRAPRSRCWRSLASGCGYNPLVSQNEQVDSAWSEIQNQLQRRNDLIPEPGEHREGLRHRRSRTCSIGSPRRAAASRARGTPSETMAASNELSERALAPAGRGRELPGAEVPTATSSSSRTSSPAPRTAWRRAQALQRRRAGVQHHRQALPDLPDRAHVRLPGEAYFDAPEAARDVPKVQF